MKLKLLYTATAFLVAHFVTAQVLWSENFDNLTVGNIGTDHTGNTPGQGGWYTRCSNPLNVSNNYFKIVAEAGRGNVMEITSPDPTIAISTNFVEKRGLETVWNNRSTGNEVLKIEYDFFTGDSLYSRNNFLNHIEGAHMSLRVVYNSESGNILSYGSNYSGSSIILQYTPIPRSTWLKFIFYIDYVNKKVHFRIPSLTISGENDFDAGTPPDIPSVMAFWVSTANVLYQQSVFKFDNFVISAVNTVPLNIQEWVSSKFNVFPNPVNDVVTITNNENIGIEEIVVYDMDGKRVKEQKCKNESEIQLNIKDLASGVYMLHIKTKEGVTVKKIVKK